MILPTIILVVVVCLDFGSLGTRAAEVQLDKKSTKKDIVAKDNKVKVNSTSLLINSSTPKPTESTRRRTDDFFDINRVSRSYHSHGYRPLVQRSNARPMEMVRGLARQRYGQLIDRQGRAFVRVEVEQPFVMGRTEGEDNGYGTLHSPVYSYAPGYGPSSSPSYYDRGLYRYGSDSLMYGPPSYHSGYRPSSNLVYPSPSSRYGPSFQNYAPASNDFIPPPSSSGGYIQPSSGSATPSTSSATYGASYTVLDGPGAPYPGGSPGSSEYIIQGNGQQQSNFGYGDINRPLPTPGSNDRPELPQYGSDGYQANVYGQNSGPSGSYENVANPSASAAYNGPSVNENDVTGQQQVANQPYVSGNQNFGSQHQNNGQTGAQYVQESNGVPSIGTNEQNDSNDNNNYSTPTAAPSFRSFNRNGRREHSYSRGRHNSPIAPNAFLSTIIYRR